MKLKKLSIKNLRNIHDVQLNCDQGIHFIHGSNGQGKTSVLEAIYLLSNLRSFRDSNLNGLLQSGEEQGQSKGIFDLGGGSEAELRVDLIQNAARLEKRAYINQKLVKSAIDYFAVKLNYSLIQFHAINLNPTSTDLIRGEPGLRRNYLNQVISSENPEYLGVLKRYQKILDQKNALLKSDDKFDLQLLRILNENMVQEGMFILHERLKYLQKMSEPIQIFLSKIAPQQHPVNLGYFSKLFSAEPLYFTRHFDLPPIQTIEENLYRKLVNFESQERVRKSSLIGPHRDDVVFQVGKHDLLDVGSQGEIRSLLLALKLSELEEFGKHTGIQPVLLIDDFSSELDSTRREFLLNYLKDSGLQIFVTSTDLIETKGAKDIMIKMVQGKMESV